MFILFFFFFQAEDGIRDLYVTGVQTCALPISAPSQWSSPFTSSHVRHHHRGFFRNRFPCASSSGCFFNGITEVCFFEPLLPLLSFSGDFDLFYPGFGFGGDSPDLGDDSEEPTQWEMSAILPPTNSWGDDTAEGNSSVP